MIVIINEDNDYDYEYDENDDYDQVMVPGEWGEEACGLPIQQVFIVTS